MRLHGIFLLVFILVTVLSPGSSSPRVSFRFTEVAREAGLDFHHQNFATLEKYLVETMGSGAAFLDYNNDGWLDIYLVNGAPLTSAAETGRTRATNALYRNNGDGTFSDVTAESGTGDAGYGMGVAVADFDNDGWIDFYVTNFGPNVLYRNRGDGTFENVTSHAGVGHSGWGASAGFFDYDRDGRLDLYVTNYLEFSLQKNVECRDYEMTERTYCHPNHYRGALDVLYHNNGDGTFADASISAGIAKPEGNGLGVILTDLDRDGWPDIFVANDSVSNFLFRNKKDGTFEDLTLPSGTGYSGDGKAEAGMGVDVAALDEDGYPTLFLSHLDFETNTLYVRQGDWWYEDQTFARGLGEPSLQRVGFGTRFADLDNDADLDLFVANGHILDNIEAKRPWLSYAQLNQLFENSDGRFRDVSGSAGPGLQLKSVSRGLAMGDYDNDGDVDVLISNNNGPVHLLRNDSENSGHWLQLEFQGSRSNRQGIGVKVTLAAGKRKRFYEVTGGGSYLSAQQPGLHIGLGSDTNIDSLLVEWPSGASRQLQNVTVDQRLVIREPEVQ